MKAVDRTKFKEIFEAALRLPFGERADLLSKACIDNTQMRVDIEKLLAADDAAGDFLESSPFDDPVSEFTSINSHKFIGQTIDDYYIEREIGSGGMGTVFLAIRSLGDISQKVAMKIVHDGHNSNEIIRRFLIERKILATLEHSGIARMIDAGQTVDRVPYLVMEYVDGRALDEYCRANELSLDERLNIFRKICDAVAYAHRRLIVHRDLKPSNVLITPNGEAKLLDFGIAKLLTPVDADTRTATLMNLLTPAYASPEQIRGETITTAADVYSLGVILYELLAGVRPFSFGDKNYQEIVRVICDTDPAAPSEVWREIETHRPGNTAKNVDIRTTKRPPARLRASASELRGDLDNIILKALRKDPERRYQSVEQFSEDIGRYQNGLPVSARADTFAYRATKFLERNRMAVASASLIVLLLIGGIVGISWQAVRAARQQKIAEERFMQVRELANKVIFKYHDSIANLNGSTEVRKMLVEDATRYLDSLSQDAGSDEDLQNELALAYSKLADVQGKPFYANTGDTTGALANYQKSIALLEGLTRSKNSANVLRAVEALIPVYHSYSALNSRAFNFEEAVASQSKALNLAQQQLELDPQDLKRRLTFARANLWLGDAFSENGSYSESIDRYRQFLTLADEIYSSNPGDREAATSLGVAHDRLGRSSMLRGQELARTDFPPEKVAEIFRDSHAHLTKTLELFEMAAAQNPGNPKYERNLTAAQANLGQAERDLGSYEDSLRRLQKIVNNDAELLKADPGNQQFKADHAEHLEQLALTLDAKNESKNAIETIRSAKQIIDELISEDRANMEFRRIRLDIVNAWGNAAFKKGDSSGALQIYQTALEQTTREAELSGHSFASFSEGLLNQNIGDCYAELAKKISTPAPVRQQNLEKAETYYRQALNSWQQPDVQRAYLARTPELLAYLKQKLPA